ncbi:hypothetical protein LQV05_004433 [Cryptococcus neoformans]|nr:hypothetical protein LQV05_004433 [Cryptococcus neoformans]
MHLPLPKPRPVPPRIPLLHPKPLVVLAFESSADDSSASIVSCPAPSLSTPPLGTNHRLLALSTLAQHPLNSIYGGIHPLHAQISHATNIPRALALCLQHAKHAHGLAWDDIDAVAYTRGPGMKGCLGVGQDAARALAAGLEKGLVGVHHMQAHALTPLLTAPAAPKFPDVFEKSARLLSLPTSLPPSPPQAPGAILEHYAALPPLPPYDTHPLPASQLIPIPLTTLRAKHTLAWSFAGMLASLQRAVHARKPTWDEPDRRAFSSLFQTALTTHLLTKLSQRIALLPPETRHQLGGMVVSGGVASNAYIRSQLERLVKDENGLFPAGARNLYYPPRHLCTDNAAMIAHTALIRLQAGLKSDPDDLQLRAKWSLEDMYDDVPEEAYLFKGAREIGMGL